MAMLRPLARHFPIVIPFVSPPKPTSLAIRVIAVATAATAIALPQPRVLLATRHVNTRPVEIKVIRPAQVLLPTVLQPRVLLATRHVNTRSADIKTIRPAQVLLPIVLQPRVLLATRHVNTRSADIKTIRPAQVLLPIVLQPRVLRASLHVNTRPIQIVAHTAYQRPLPQTLQPLVLLAQPRANTRYVDDIRIIRPVIANIAPQAPQPILLRIPPHANTHLIRLRVITASSSNIPVIQPRVFRAPFQVNHYTHFAPLIVTTRQTLQLLQPRVLVRQQRAVNPPKPLTSRVITASQAPLPQLIQPSVFVRSKRTVPKFIPRLITPAIRQVIQPLQPVVLTQRRHITVPVSKIVPKIVYAGFMLPVIRQAQPVAYRVQRRIISTTLLVFPVTTLGDNYAAGINYDPYRSMAYFDRYTTSGGEA